MSNENRSHRIGWPTFAIYIRKIQKQIDPEYSISKKAVELIDDYLMYIGAQIAHLSNEHRLDGLKSKLTVEMLESGIIDYFAARRERGKLIGSSLFRNSIKNGRIAVKNYKIFTKNALEESRETGEKRPRVSNEKKSEITISVSRTRFLVRKGSASCQLAPTIPVYLAAVLEYLASEFISSGIIKRAERHEKSKKKVSNSIISNFDVSDGVGESKLLTNTIKSYTESIEQ
jgi:hypothetical protein